MAPLVSTPVSRAHERPVPERDAATPVSLSPDRDDRALEAKAIGTDEGELELLLPRAEVVARVAHTGLCAMIEQRGAAHVHGARARQDLAGVRARLPHRCERESFPCRWSRAP